ncbi:uncharacterized protein LOC27208233 [Drosophila simulans]|uniref:uncharacterized protein LOC27208233 n=1 Tax=Drosophila simulans TaxID=7240 RepID=UPI00192CEAB0|nr:uncharacterized protein LOC27208233 [Drosophila simulans]
MPRSVRVVNYQITKCVPLSLSLFLPWSQWPPPKDLVLGVPVDQVDQVVVEEDQDADLADRADLVDLADLADLADLEDPADLVDQEVVDLEDQVAQEDQEAQEAPNHGDHHAIKPHPRLLRPQQALPPPQLLPLQCPPPQSPLRNPRRNPPRHPPQNKSLDMFPFEFCLFG